jgi:hypothetical protein
LAVAGTAAVLVWQAATAVGSLAPRQEYGFAVLGLAVVAVGLAFLRVLPAETGRLFRHPDLLVPLGLYVTVDIILGLLAKVPGLAAVLTPAWPAKIFSLGLSLSLSFALQVVLAVLYAGWTTVLVLQAVRRDRVDLAGAFAGTGRWSPRAFGALFIGWAVLFAGMIVAVAIGSANITLALVLIAGGSLAWNLATAALLPVAIVDPRPFPKAVGEGIRVSWRRKGRWWLPLVLQMILLGWVTWVHVSYAVSPRPGMVTTHTRTSWHVHGFWTGGYADTCHWHTDLMNVAEVPPLPLVNTLLTLVFGVLAVAVKLRVVAGLSEPPSGQPANEVSAPDDRV